MSGTGFGYFMVVAGLLLLGVHEQIGLVLLICGFTCAFTGMATRQDRQLKEARMRALTGPQGDDSGMLASEDQRRARDVMAAAALPILPVSLPMQPGEYACYRSPAVLHEVRQTNRLGGGYMAWGGVPPVTDEGELYVTTRRICFSGQRHTREFPLKEISSLQVGTGFLEVWREGRPCPLRFGVAFPGELGAYIDRARQESAANILPAFPEPAPRWQSTSQTAVRSGPREETLPAEAMVKCPSCGAANGLSANFCQNCAAPITAGRTPTLNYRPSSNRGE